MVTLVREIGAEETMIAGAQIAGKTTFVAGVALLKSYAFIARAKIDALVAEGTFAADVIAAIEDILDVHDPVAVVQIFTTNDK